MANAEHTKTSTESKPVDVKIPAKAPKEPKVAKEPKPPRYLPAGTVTMLKTKDGTKQYGPVTDESAKPLPIVNPKRGKSTARFANYRDGITIADLQKNYEKSSHTGMVGDLDWDIRHGLVQYNPPKSA